MAGNITKRGDRCYLVRVNLGTDDGGKRHVHTHTVHGTKKDAEMYLNAVLRKRDLGDTLETDDTTMGAFLDKWLAFQRTRGLKYRTMEGYQATMDLHVRPALGNLPVAKVTTMMVQDFYSMLAGHVGKTAKGNPRPMGPSGIRKVHAVLRAAMETAVAWRIRPDNPVRYAKPPKLEQKERPAISGEMARRFVEAMAGVEKGIVFLVALATGMRPQEYLALKWTDLDWATRRLSVGRVMTRLKGGGWIMEEPKTQKSRRTIVVPPGIIPALREHKARQNEERLRAGRLWLDEGFMFTNELGAPLHTNAISGRAWRRAKKAAGLPEGVRPYDLRHACATVLLEAGEDLKSIADQLGHSTIQLTANTYAHVTTGMKERTAARLDQALFGEG